MFSKGKITDTPAPQQPAAPQPRPASAAAAPQAAKPDMGAEAKPAPKAATPKPKPSPSLLSSDLVIKGNLTTSGDIQCEGTIEGDVRAHLITVGQTATIRGEVVADDVVVDGRVVGRVRGLKVRLTATAQVEGDIVHKTIAIESGAHFEGSVQRQEDPLSDGVKSAPKPMSAPLVQSSSPEAAE